jgi:hypothetical protein
MHFYLRYNKCYNHSIFRYHSSLIAPKSTLRKQELYDWLVKHKSTPGVHINLKPITEMLRPELWDLVKTVNALPAMQGELYEVDALAKSKGHEILRLAPYNCDLSMLAYNH